MSTFHRTQLLTASLVLVFGCIDAGNRDDGEDPNAELAQACVNNCLKPLCSTTVTVGPGYEAECESRCEDRASQAEDEACSEAYAALLACLEEASCETYYLWYDQEPEAPCTDLEAELTGLCPSIDVRDAD